jgi:hypothetical protein
MVITKCLLYYKAFDDSVMVHLTKLKEKKSNNNKTNSIISSFSMSLFLVFVLCVFSYVFVPAGCITVECCFCVR